MPKMSGIEWLTKAESPWIDHNVARAVARLLLSRTTVKDMYIFGSVARVGQGRDLDVVVTPAVPEIADEFIDRVNAVWTEKGYQTADIPKRLPAVRWSEA